MSLLRSLDPDLVAQATRGDPVAIERLLDQSRPELRRFARRACATSQDAEDAVQLALFQAHRKLGTLRAVQALAGWLFRIVERECRRLLRVSQRVEPLVDWDAADEGAAVPAELRRVLHRAIAAMPEIHREILILRDIEELTALEAAQHLGISVQAAKSRLHRARGMLRASLTQSGYFNGDEPETSR
jgi:RNA polymerase sigma factor (sigma-70 family)